MIKSKRAHQKPHQIQTPTQAQIAELLKCIDDPKHFIETHLAVMNTSSLPIPLKLWKEQVDYIDVINEFNTTICKHPRQAGISTASLAYILWRAQFKSDHTAFVVLPSLQHLNFAKSIIGTMHSNIPSYICSEVLFENQYDVRYENGSKIMFRTPSGTVARGISAGTVYVGDLAYFDPIEAHMFWMTIVPTVSKTGKLIVHSSATDPFHLFFDLWDASVKGLIPMCAHEINFWDLHDATQAKWNTLEAQLGSRVMRRSYGGEFLS